MVLTESRLKHVYISNVCSKIDDEFHVIMHIGPLYDDVRSSCFNFIHALSREFYELTLEHQFIEIMSYLLYYRIASKFMYGILTKIQNTKTVFKHGMVIMQQVTLARQLLTE